MTDLERSNATDDLVALAQELGADPIYLAGAVREAKAEEAADINTNGGLREQIAYLAGSYSPSVARRLIEAAAGRDK